MEAVCSDIELTNCSRGVTVWHAQMRHPVQRRTSHQHLRRLPAKLPRADTVAEDCFHPKHLRLGKTPPMITYFLLPLLSPHSPDAPQILIADQSVLLRIPVPPNPSIPTWRDRRFRLPLTDGFIAIALVIRSIAADLFDLLVNLLKQVFEHLRVGQVVCSHHRRHDLARSFIGADVKFSPSAALPVAVSADFPFAFTEDFNAGGIYHHVQRFIVFAARQSHLQGGAAAAQLAVRDDGQVQVKQLGDRKHQALVGAQRQMIDLFERSHAQYGRVTVGTWMARFAALFGVAPSHDNVIADPEGQASALHEG